MAESSFLFTTEGLLAFGTAIAMSVAALVRAELLARRAVEKAIEVRVIASEAQTQCAALNGSLSMFREQVASNYVNRQMMRELEDRLSADIENMNRNVTAAIGSLTSRLDRVLEVREHRAGRQS